MFDMVFLDFTFSLCSVEVSLFSADIAALVICVILGSSVLGFRVEGGGAL